MIEWWLVYLVMGLFVGLFAGLLGIGGGTLLVPLMVFVFTAQGFENERILHLAIGTSLASIVFTSISSIRAHHARGAVLWPVFKNSALFLIVGTLLGSLFADSLDPKILASLFMVFAFYSAAQLILNIKPKSTRNLPSRIGLGVGASLVGVLSSLVGVGGGVITIPLMVMCNIPMRNAVGTSAALGLPIAAAGTIGYVSTGLGENLMPSLSVGYVYLPALAGIVFGTFITVPFGAKLAHSLPVGTLKKIFAFVLLGLAIKMFTTIFEV